MSGFDLSSDGGWHPRLTEGLAEREGRESHPPEAEAIEHIARAFAERLESP